MRIKLAALMVATAFIATSAEAKTVSGSAHGISWSATSNIIGKTSTATVSGGGDPRFLAQRPRYSGTVGLLMDYGAGGQFVCSGSLVGGNSIVTAGHCVSDGSSKRPDKVTAFFYDGNSTDPVVYRDGAIGVTTVDVGAIHVNPLYTGEVIDDHDIAVLKLVGAPPSFAKAYGFYTGTDLTGLSYRIAGYGGRSDVGGALGVDLSVGRLRQGVNRYDFRLGDPDFQGFFAGGPNGFFGTAETDFSYISDFDSGARAQDASCRLAVDGFGLAPSGKYCNRGGGRTEVSSAGGDSGGPQFIHGKLASVTSFGLSFGTGFGDIDGKVNSTFGEFNGFVPIFNNIGFLNGAVPEPSTWAMMVVGFGVVGGAMRRRQSEQKTVSLA